MIYVLLEDRPVAQWASYELSEVKMQANEEYMTEETLRCYVRRLVAEVQRLRSLDEGSP